MRVAIYGAGGLGGFYGARLAQSGHEVGFIARGDTLAALRSNGLKVLSPMGDLHIERPRVSDAPVDIGPVDLVIVAVKTWQIPEIAKQLSPLLRDDTVVIPFLNGVEAADGLAAEAGSERVMGGLSKVFSLIEAPGVIRHLSAGADTEIGELDGSANPRGEKICEVLRAAGIGCETSADIRSALWRKLLMVSSWSGLGALARSPIDVIRARAGSRELVDRSMREGLAVGRALGHSLPDDVAAQLWAFYDSLPKGTTSSMLRDLIAGKPSELEAWNGAVVRFGRKAGVATPVNDMVLELLLPMERRARGQSALT